jgi:hypothetical protein
MQTKFAEQPSDAARNPAEKSIAPLEHPPLCIAGFASRMLRALQRLAARRTLVCILTGILPMVIRVAALHYDPFPEPSTVDESSYLLAADTFASGRLTNPPHPMWVHFEAWQEGFQPTYFSKYPPAQGMFLALGQRLLGHPWFGVCLSFGFMCACLCWMLQGWMPPVYALLGTLVAMGQLSMFGYWMDSYWGGAVAAAGGCLLLGALPRMVHRVTTSAVIVGCMGVVILAFSRPLEGLVVIVAAAVALLIWRRRLGKRPPELIAPRVLIPVLLIGGLAVGAMAYYNYRVTGHPLQLPYFVVDQQYVAYPLFWFQHLKKIPPSPHEEMRRFWEKDGIPNFLSYQRHPWKSLLRMSGLSFYASPLVLFAFLIGSVSSRDPKVRAALAILAVALFEVLFETQWQIHYVAPAMGLIFLISMQGVRFLRLKVPRLGPTLLLLFVFEVFGQGILGLGSAHRISAPRSVRSAVTATLMEKGGRHLVIVQYDPHHSPPPPEHVYNDADIDRSPIVWARDMGDSKNKELLDYYPDRSVWLLQPDQTPFLLTRYPASLLLEGHELSR